MEKISHDCQSQILIVSTTSGLAIQFRLGPTQCSQDQFGVLVLARLQRVRRDYRKRRRLQAGDLDGKLGHGAIRAVEPAWNPRQNRATRAVRYGAKLSIDLDTPGR